MNSEVALSALALAGSTVVGLIWIVKFLAKKLNQTLIEHTKAAIAQTQASNEVLNFMIKLNGKLEKATIQKVNEMNVANQTVNNQFVDNVNSEKIA